MQIALGVSKIWDKLIHFPEIFTSVLATREGWKELLIPVLSFIGILSPATTQGTAFF